LKFLIKKISVFFTRKFFQFLVIATLDPDWIRIRIDIQHEMLDNVVVDIVSEQMSSSHQILLLIFYLNDKTIFTFHHNDMSACNLSSTIS
jgi:hypothetical protein